MPSCIRLTGTAWARGRRVAESTTVGQLQFSVAELVDEVRTVKRLAEPFLDTTTTWTLDRLAQDLDQAASRDAAERIAMQPLRTRPSEGEYEPASRSGGLRVQAEVRGEWAVRPVRDKGRRGSRATSIEFCGIAYTRIEVHTVGPDGPTEPVAVWRMDLGADDAPGCYFHTHVLGETDEPPFPKALTVPRLPSLFVTAPSVLEFVLAELFQGQWHAHLSRSGGQFDPWKALQRRRLAALLEWQLDCVARGRPRRQFAGDQRSQTSAWAALKDAKPPHNLFMQ